MKKMRLLALSTLILLSWGSEAQESYVGIRTGYSRAVLQSDDESLVSLDPRNGFTGALVLSTKFDNLPIGLSIEPGYVLKGAQINSDTLDYKFHYFNMPLLLNLFPVDRVKLSLGVEPAYLKSAKNHVNDSTRTDLLNTYDNRWEVSWTAGASFSLVFFMDIGVRYTQSFTKLATQDAIIDRRNLYTQYLQLFLIIKVAN